MRSNSRFSDHKNPFMTEKLRRRSALMVSRARALSTSQPGMQLGKKQSSCPGSTETNLGSKALRSSPPAQNEHNGSLTRSIVVWSQKSVNSGCGYASWKNFEVVVLRPGKWHFNTALENSSPFRPAASQLFWNRSVTTRVSGDPDPFEISPILFPVNLIASTRPIALFQTRLLQIGQLGSSTSSRSPTVSQPENPKSRTSRRRTPHVSTRNHAVCIIMVGQV